jgi:hypothetical protein
MMLDRFVLQFKLVCKLINVLRSHPYVLNYSRPVFASPFPSQKGPQEPTKFRIVGHRAIRILKSVGIIWKND